MARNLLFDQERCREEDGTWPRGCGEGAEGRRSTGTPRLSVSRVCGRHPVHRRRGIAAPSARCATPPVRGQCCPGIACTRVSPPLQLDPLEHGDSPRRSGGGRVRVDPHENVELPVQALTLLVEPSSLLVNQEELVGAGVRVEKRLLLHLENPRGGEPLLILRLSVCSGSNPSIATRSRSNSRIHLIVACSCAEIL